MDVTKSIDDFVMYGVDKFVHAINYTTGHTKKEISNTLFKAAPVLEGSGMLYSSSNPVISTAIGLPFCVLYLGWSHIAHLKNETMEELELKALESECKDMNVEKLKNDNKFYAYLFKGIGLFGYCSSFNFKEPEGYIVLMTGHLTRSLAHNVARCDYYPPRKNVVKRAYEKLSETIEEALVPEPKPVPIMSPYLSNNFNNF
ncbi:hypothetical protein KY334_04655 [Candidatus Woesearchaeota archaeon]|nr:hypothetical protein [Candidatus Woesearchaeota archaeon]